MTDVRNTFAVNVRSFRKRMELSQVLLAQRTNLSQGYIADLERGTKFPSPETLDKLCESLEVRPYQLFLGEDEIVANINDPLVTANLERIRREIHTLIDAMLTKTFEDMANRSATDKENVLQMNRREED